MGLEQDWDSFRNLDGKGFFFIGKKSRKMTFAG